MNKMLYVAVYQFVALASVVAVLLLMTRATPARLLMFISALTLAAIAVFVAGGGETSSDQIKGFIKFTCAMPLGLGSLVGFQCLSSHTRKRHFRSFTHYVNAAVLGNIAMMVCVPDGGLRRGWTSRATCVGLVAWLWLEMQSRRWVTIEMPSAVPITRSGGVREDEEGGGEEKTVYARQFKTDAADHHLSGNAHESRECVSRIANTPSPLNAVLPPFPPYLIFTAVPMSWILCHAAYRAVMVSLPAFDSPRYWLMEPLSLGVMWYLHSLCRSRDDDAKAALPPPTTCDGSSAEASNAIRSNESDTKAAQAKDGNAGAMKDEAFPSKAIPLHFFFGLADTVVVATMGTVSHIADCILGDVKISTMLSEVGRTPANADATAGKGEVSDWLGVAAHVAVLSVCVYSISRHLLLAQ